MVATIIYIYTKPLFILGLALAAHFTIFIVSSKNNIFTYQFLSIYLLLLLIKLRSSAKKKNPA